MYYLGCSHLTPTLYLLYFGNARIIYELPYYNRVYALPPGATLYHFLAAIHRGRASPCFISLRVKSNKLTLIRALLRAVVCCSGKWY